MTYSPLEPTSRAGAAAFLLVYCTLFLDNVLLTALVPILPEWSGATAAPAVLRNGSTISLEAGDAGGEATAAGAVLGARSAAQLACAPLAATMTTRVGPAATLRLAVLLLLAAATGLSWCGSSVCAAGGAACLWCGAAGRVLQGSGGALGGVAGMALVSRAVSPSRRQQALGASLGAVALGVLVGYPLGGATAGLWSSAAPFHLVAGALLANLGLQYAYLKKPEYDKPAGDEPRSTAWGECARGVWNECGAGAGAVFLSTAVMAALEPCLPLWLERRFGAQRWELGLVFLPDSVAYLAATSGSAALCGGRGLRAQRVALTGLCSVALGGVLVARACSLGALAIAQACVGAGVGALDAALVPALLARADSLPHAAALLQAAASAAYAVGPVAAGAIWWAAGFGATLRALAVANVLYAALLYRHFHDRPLPDQPGSQDGTEARGLGSELLPLSSPSP
ncbi:chromaffin granule amine transporter [Pieris rapae]|uniref:chromaffin granule amine transporter n=1 Tax=Pieris rapae TaxID=64459 RepID=UPI001E27DE00|nr:chromaffin granule amine transporter [Pieris rapae]